MIQKMEGDANKNLELYATTGSKQYCDLVESIRQQMNVNSLKFNPLETLVKAIGLPKECICTHCFDGAATNSRTDDGRIQAPCRPHRFSGKTTLCRRRL